MLDPDKNIPVISLNKEVRAFATVKLRSGIHKEIAGEPVYEHEVDDIQKITLTQDDTPNSGHVTLIRFREKWIMHFDFRYNKQKARERFDAGKEFYNVAKYCFDAKLLRPFVDILFSATELLVTTQLFVISEADYPSKAKHKNIQDRYNSFIKIGNPKAEYVEALNKLSGLRDDARYLRKPFQLDEEEAKKS